MCCSACDELRQVWQGDGGSHAHGDACRRVHAVGAIVELDAAGCAHVVPDGWGAATPHEGAVAGVEDDISVVSCVSIVNTSKLVQHERWHYGMFVTE